MSLKNSNDTFGKLTRELPVTKISVYNIIAKRNTNFEVYRYKVGITNVYKISIEFQNPADILPRSV